MDKKRNILNYWYNMEFFSPFWPEKTKNTTYVSRSDSQMPWITQKETKYHYDIYLGKMTTQDWVEYMLCVIGKIEDEIEKGSSKSCVCALRVNSDGMYIENSFSISAFVCAMAHISAEKTLRTNLVLKEIEKINNEMNDVLRSIRQTFEQKDLEEIYASVVEKLLLKPGIAYFYAVINKKYIKKEEEIDTGIGMLFSSYVSDIDMIRKKMQNGDRIGKYIEATRKPVTSHIEIDKDIARMKKWLLPEKYPLGKWPSTDIPNLMQQMAINIGVSEEEEIRTNFSVNQPQGTGKTIFLKGIIASYLVERSIFISQYKNPDDAFTKHQFDLPKNKYLTHYYQPVPELKKYGILIASNNNAALEEISKELFIAENPMRNGEECWSLISLRLGKESNINELKDLQQLYKQQIPDWKQAKDAFQNKYQEVLAYRKEIQEAVRKIVEHDFVMREYKDSKIQLETISKERTEQKTFLKEVVKEKYGIQHTMETLEKNAELLHRRLGIWKKLFSFLFQKDSIMQELKRTRQELDAVVIQYTEQNAQLSALQVLIDKTEFDYQKECRDFEKKKILFQDSCEQIEQYREQFGVNFADEKFWRDIQRNENSQTACPWIDAKYGTLREELFYHGRMLHQAFILNSQGVKHNIDCLVNIWSGNCSEKDKIKGFSDLINTLFLVIPVISTTFDSVSSSLRYVDKNELGTLIIDEGGQMTPYSALGALWRTCKAIVIGDPLHIDPVVPVPKELSERFADEFGIESSYRL